MDIHTKLKNSQKRLNHLLALKKQRDKNNRKNKYVIFACEQGHDVSKHDEFDGHRIGSYKTRTDICYYRNPNFFHKLEEIYNTKLKREEKEKDIDLSMDRNKISLIDTLKSPYVLFTAEQAKNFVKNFPSPNLIKFNVIPVNRALKKGGNA